jgi:glycosyltransferase involved in cell wall biosynthesis
MVMPKNGIIFARRHMVIAVNTRFLLKNKLEGIGWFTHETLKRMVLVHPEHEFIFIFDRPFHPQFVFAPNVTPVIANPPARHPILWWLWFEIAIPRILKKYKADVFLSTDGFCSLSTTIPQVIVIHDLAFLHYPKYLKFSIAQFLKIYTKKYIAKANAIIGVSQYTVQDIINTYKVPEHKMHLVYNSANDLYKPLDFAQKQDVKIKYAQGVDYFVYAGSLHPRKNIVNLLKAFALFKRNTKSNMKLLLVGRMAWKTESIANALQNHPNKTDIIRYEYMEAEELCQVIASAYAMLYVSEFEGFGIPILEALRCNVPAITSNTSSMPEVGGNACLYANPNDYVEIADQIMLLYNDENVRNKLITNCALQAAKFSWDNSAHKLFNIIISQKK